ncbi:MAG: AAA family ATPase, partial [Coriobacteriaceae bacterium]|nr:AAA family ATPase [Coriobacteriaceae bacterium]
ETSSPSFLRRKTGILFGGDTGLYEELTAHENILFHGRLRHVDDERIARREYELAEALRVSEYLERRVSELSTGTRQKVAIIRVLIHDPQAIIFDEPEAGLDFSAVRTVLQFLRDQAHECSRIVIISSHSFGDVLEVTDDIAILNHGRLTSIVETRKLTEGHSLQDSFAELERLAIGDA